MSIIEQRYALKFCVKLGKTPTESHNLLIEAYGDSALSRARVYEWHKRFKDGRESVENDDGAGRPNTSINKEKVLQVSNILQEEPRLSVGIIAARVGISVGSCHSILHEQLGMNRVCSKWVPRLLNPIMKADRVAKCQEILDMKFHEGEAFLTRIVTGDESWLHFYDPLTKQQSSVWKTPDDPRPVKAKMTKSAGKVLLVIFFDSEGIVYHRYVEEGHTINSVEYIDILSNLKLAIQRKRPRYQQSSWLLLHDNAPSHTSRLTQQFLQRNNIDSLPHLPYSPDLAPCDFWLFQNLEKNHFVVRNFRTKMN